MLATHSFTVKWGPLFKRFGFVCLLMFQWYDSLLVVGLHLGSLVFFTNSTSWWYLCGKTCIRKV